jgi:omega-amidase
MAPRPSSTRIAIGQVRMHWTIEDNMAAISSAIRLSKTQGAEICAFSELAITGFHRQIAALAKPELIEPAVERIKALCAQSSVAVAIGAPTFGSNGSKYITHLLIDQSGRLSASVSKHGLTEPEATFFSRGSGRPIGNLQGVRCSAVICREIEDFSAVTAELPPGSADVVFIPGGLRQDPAKPISDPPPYVDDIRALAVATRSYMVQTNWPNALNRPEESVDAGQSAVVSPEGELLFRLPKEASGVGVFTLGERAFEWHPR